MHAHGRSVAVIGSGVAGLVAAHVLSARDRVTLFEADTRLGGHAHTHFLDRGDGSVVGVDTRVPRAQRPHLPHAVPAVRRTRDCHPRDGHVDVCPRRCRADSSTRGPAVSGACFLRRSTLGRPRYLRMLSEIKRFHRSGDPTARRPSRRHETLDSFLDRHGFSRYFVDHFMTPLVAAVWSCRAGRGAELPRALPLRVPRTPRHALGVRLAHVAHGGRRLGQLRRSHRSTGSTSSCAGDPVTSVQRVADGVEITAPHHAGFRCRSHRDASRPGAPDARRTQRRRTSGPRRDPLLHQPRPVAHRRIGAPPPSPGKGLVELPRHPERRQRRWSPTTSPD